ncbi:MAG: DUF6134 family protein [Hyphomonadaceae bacterium]
MRALIAALAVSLTCAFPAGAAETPGRSTFQVLRNGSPFGSHTIEVRAGADGVLIAESRAHLQVKLGPITFFRYRQDCDETWAGGRIETLRCVTLKDGKHTNVAMRRTGEGLSVTVDDGRATILPANTQPTSWWSRSVLQAGPLIDTQTGKRTPALTVEHIGRGPFTLNGAAIQADHYRVHGTTTIDLWYDAAGHWVGCVFTARGQRVEYRLTSDPNDGPT